MQGASQSTLPRKLRRGLLALGALVVLGAGAAHGENLDQGKSATRLFADSCTACHRSARGLARGRFRVTLFLFLQEHYATNSSSAWELTSYLESVDGAKHGPRATAAKPASAARRASGTSLRPPMPVPQR
jgi:hypothetical protein